jgi:WD40 repeat protein
VPSQLFKKAVARAQSGDKANARRIFLEIVETDPLNESAWLWLADSLPTDNQRIAALEQCLKHIPDSKNAKKALVLFKGRPADTAEKIRKKGRWYLPIALIIIFLFLSGFAAIYLQKNRNSPSLPPTEISPTSTNIPTVLPPTTTPIIELPTPFPTKPPMSGIYVGPIPDNAWGRIGKGTISSLDISPLSNRIAVGGSLGITLYQLDTFKETAWLEEQSWIEQVAFSSDGTLLISITSGGEINLWDVQSQEHISTLQETSGGSIALSPVENILATTAEDGKLHLYELDEISTHSLLAGPEEDIRSLAFSADGSAIALGTKSGVIWVVDWQQAEIIWDINTRSQQKITSLAFSQDGALLASGSEEGTLALWNATTGKEITHTLSVPIPTELTEIIFSPDGDNLVVQTVNDTIAILDLQNNDEKHVLEGSGCQIEPGGSTLICLLGNNIIRWDLQKGEQVEVFDQHLVSVTLAYSPDGTTLATGSPGGEIFLWEADTGEYRQTLIAHTAEITNLSFSLDNDMLASTSQDKSIILWDVESGKALQRFDEHAAHTTSIAFSPDSQTLAAGYDDSVLFLWDIQTGEAQLELGDHDGKINSVAFSQDGKALASASQDGKIILWEAGSGNILRTLEVNTQEILSIAFSPDGETLVSGSVHEKANEDTIAFWNWQSGELLESWSAPHLDDVTYLAFSPGGSTLASASLDKKVILWDRKTGDILQSMIGHTGGIYSIAFTPNGETLASVSQDGTVVFWSIKHPDHPEQPANMQETAETTSTLAPLSSQTP